jgi:GDP-4-dehydro-6-deoxy-D-mannose reductase
MMAGTSEEYGDGGPNEDDLINPLSPYAISKVAMDFMGRLYARAYGIPVVVTRAFNHCGPGRGEMYAESSFAKQIVEIENNQREFIEHGNLSTVRNYTDVRDIVRAYTMAIDLPSGVYNICSSQNVEMQVIMDLLIKNANIPIETKVNSSLFRPSDFSFKKPSCKKFKQLTGWKTEYKLEQTLVDILDDWRERL